MKITKGEGIGACSLVRNILGVEGHGRAPGWGLGRLISNSITHLDLHKSNNMLVSVQLEHFWCTDKPQTNTISQDSPRPRLGGNHHLPPYSIFCAWPRDQHPNVILSRDCQVGVSKFPKLGLPQLWRPITLCANLRLRWGLKKIYNVHWELFNGMWNATCTQGNQGDSRLLVLESQIANLTPSPSFAHNLCFRYPNGSCKPILDIYVLRYFQWYKELFNPMSFDPWNHPLKIRESIRIPTPKVGAHLGMWGFIPSHSLALPRAWNVTPELTLGPHLCKPLLWSQAQG